METTVINLLGSPGTGKSTIAAGLFNIMKNKGYDVELVTEYAKELVWEERNETFKNEVYIFAKQHQRMFRLNKKVEYIITDRPLILSSFYNKVYNKNQETLNNLVLEEVSKFNNINIFLNRTKPYVTKGCKQTEEESNHFANDMLVWMKNHDKNLHIIDAIEKSPNKIFHFILNLHKKELNKKELNNEELLLINPQYQYAIDNINKMNNIDFENTWTFLMYFDNKFHIMLEKSLLVLNDETQKYLYVNPQFFIKKIKNDFESGSLSDSLIKSLNK